MQVKRRHSGGYSLVEILVAMAIFVVIFSGVVALFAGAVNTTATMRAVSQGFELGRGTLEALTQDLEGACTAREQGAALMFCGRPEGFSFVTVLPSGKIGRVTYVTHEGLPEDNFTTTITEFKEDSEPDPAKRKTNIKDIIIGQMITEMVKDRLTLPQAQARADAYYATLSQTVLASSNPFVECNVQVIQYSLLRYEEASPDLYTFPLPYGMQGAEMPWPMLDRLNPDYDTLGDGARGQAVYDYLLRGILVSSMGEESVGPENDLRRYLSDPGNARDLYALSPEVISELVSARRRELWFHMLADDAVLKGTGLPSFWAGAGENYLDYVVQEKFFSRAFLTDSGGNPVMYRTRDDQYGRDLAINLLYMPGPFSYGNEAQISTKAFSEYFNDNRNIPGYEDLLANTSESIESKVLRFDDKLQETFGASTVSEDTYGSPLLPRIPATINIGFWIMVEKTQPGSSDFRRWFSQAVDVPAGFTRDMFPRVTPAPG